MYRMILDKLCCPVCKKDLALVSDIELNGDIVEGSLKCENGHTYHIHEGVADFNSSEQSFVNEWESMGNSDDFEDLDRQMDEKNAASVTQRQKKTLESILNAVMEQDHGTILDVASGRGLLLAELVNSVEDDVHIISIDLSAYILKYDYRKFQKSAPNKRISYLACDACNIPLKDYAVDMAVSFCGFSNMIGCADKALKDVNRVIKENGTLVDSYIVIHKDSKGYQAVQQVCADQNISGGEEFFLHDQIFKHHNALFSAVSYRVAFEGLGIDNGMDLLPYDGEWYADQIFVSKK